MGALDYENIGRVPNMNDISHGTGRQKVAGSFTLMSPRQKESLGRFGVWAIERLGFPIVLSCALGWGGWSIANRVVDSYQEFLRSTIQTQGRQADTLEKIADQHGEMVKLLDVNADNTAENGERLEQIRAAIERTNDGQPGAGS